MRIWHLKRAPSTPTRSRAFTYGSCPEIMAIDGSAKIATDHVTDNQFKIPRKARDIDADLQYHLLVLGMLSLMVFGKRLQR